MGRRPVLPRGRVRAALSCTHVCEKLSGSAVASGEQRANHASLAGVSAPRSLGRSFGRPLTMQARQLRDDVFPLQVAFWQLKLSGMQSLQQPSFLWCQGFIGNGPET